MRTIWQAKRGAFVDQLGMRLVGEVCGMIKKMGGERRDWSYPVLSTMRWL